MEYRVEHAVYEDLNRIGDIYAYARAFMAQTGNPTQWGTTHPPMAQLEADVRKQKLYVVRSDSQIHGVFYFAVEEDPTYAKIYDGGWHSEESYGVIHRIASSGSGGVLRTAVEFACEQVPCLRIDTHADNHVMQKALEKLGFRKCGIIYIADGTPRIAYDYHV